MRTPSEIRNALIDALNGSINWKKLQNSVVGRELIYFGANVIQQSDAIIGSIEQAFDYKFTDANSLIGLSHAMDIGISFVRPSYIRVRVNTDKVYKPFDLVYSIGGVNFYNISYVRGGEDVVLYQGIVRSMDQTGTNISGFNIVPSEVWDDTQILSDTESSLIVHLLGKAMPESVFLFKKDNSGEGIISPYTVLRSGPESEMYKLFTLYDGSLSVMLGDGVWGKSEYPSTLFQIVWLEPTNVAFELNGSLSDGESIIESYTVLGNHLGADVDIQYARDTISRWHLRNATITSESRIKDYVNSYPYILDSSVSALNNNIIVYVKPTDPTDVGGYDVIASELDLYGTLFANHKVIPGTPLTFQFMVRGSSNKTSQIEEYLSSEYGYEKLPYDFRINLSKVAAQIQSVFDESLNFLFNVNTRVVSGSTLKFLPIEGSIKLVDTLGSVAGFDSNGVLMGRVTGAATTLKVTEASFECINDLFLYNNVHTLNRNAALKVGVQQGTVTKQGSYVFVEKEQKYTDGNINTLFVYRNSQFTLQGWNESIIPLASVRLVGTEKRPYTVSGIPVYNNNLLYYVVSEQSKNIEVRIYSMFSDEDYGNLLQSVYTILVPYTGVVNKVLVQDSNMFLFLANNVCIQIQDFDKSSYTIQALEVDFGLQDAQILENNDKIYLFSKGSNLEFYQVTSIVPVNGILILDKVKIGEFENPFQEVVKVSAGSQSFVVYGKKDSEDLALLLEGSSSINISNIPVYLLGQIGSVDYNTGAISISVSYLLNAQYQSMMMNELSHSEYLKLNESTPVVWE